MDSYKDALSALGGRARRLRQIRNLRQHELATRAGVGLMTVVRFEKKGRASIENMLRIAVALGVEGAFEALFVPPRFLTLDEALARPAEGERKRVRKPR
jgi:transcriptional regulator with XRE-family HTH domain